MGEFTGVLYCFAFLTVGYIASAVIFWAERPAVRIWLGGVCSLVMMITLPALWAFVFDFTLIAQYAALISAIVIAAAFFLYGKKHNIDFLPGADRLKNEKQLLVLIPVFLFGCYLFYTHTIINIDGALYVGQSTYGDLAMHLGFVTSLTNQGTFPPMYSILPGTAIGYPFLCDSISATFHTLGANLRFSMLLPAILAYALVLLGVYFFFENWLKDKKITVFATLLFFIGGGLGFVYFFDTLITNPDNLSRIFTGYYTTPTNYVDKGVLWVNPIADMLVPQRATLFGWSLLFPALFMLRRAAFDGDEKMFLPLALLASCMPLVHTHSFLALGILSAVYLLQAVLHRVSKETFVKWVMYGGIVALLAFPQLFRFTFRQSQGFLRFNFNWVNSTDNYFWFYIKNMGLFFIFLPLSFFNLDKKEKQFYSGSLVIWLIAEFIQFQPNPYDNNKLLFVWFAFTCGITALFMFKVYHILKDIKGREYLTVLTLCLFFTSGVLTLGREAVSRYQLFSENDVRAARFIKENTRPDAYFLTATNHNNIVAALSGRNIHCGASIYVHFIGLDYQQRAEEVTLMYTRPRQYFPRLSHKYGIDYVMFSSHERRGIENSDESWYRDRYPVFYHKDDITIYKVI